MTIQKRFPLPLGLAAAALALLLFAACMPPSLFPKLSTQAVNAQTAVAQGKDLAATQLPVAMQTLQADNPALDPPGGTAEAMLATQVAEAVSDHPNPEVKAARDTLRNDPAMKSPWGQVNAPLKSAPGQRSASAYANAIDQFEVNASAFTGRYVAGGSGSSESRSHIFAGDVMRAMGVPLPTRGNLGKGSGNARFTDPTTAQTWLLSDYLNKKLRWITSAEDPGVESDWVLVDPTKPEGLRKLVEHVNAGKPALVANSEHIAVVRPSQPNPQRWQEVHVAQAGVENFLDDTLNWLFFGTPQFFLHE